MFWRLNLQNRKLTPSRFVSEVSPLCSSCLYIYIITPSAHPFRLSKLVPFPSCGVNLTRFVDPNTWCISAKSGSSCPFPEPWFKMRANKRGFWNEREILIKVTKVNLVFTHISFYGGVGPSKLTSHGHLRSIQILNPIKSVNTYPFRSCVPASLQTTSSPSGCWKNNIQTDNWWWCLIGTFQCRL